MSDLQEYQKALEKIELNESAMPMVNGHLVDDVDTYNKIQELLGCNEMIHAHTFLYDIDPEDMSEDVVKKVNELYQLAVDKGYVEDKYSVDSEIDKQIPDETDPMVQQERVCWTCLYSAIKNGEIRTGECYSNAADTTAARYDVIGKLSNLGFTSIEIIAIEAGDPELCGAPVTIPPNALPDVAPPRYPTATAGDSTESDSVPTDDTEVKLDEPEDEETDETEEPVDEGESTETPEDEGNESGEEEGEEETSEEPVDEESDSGIASIGGSTEDTESEEQTGEEDEGESEEPAEEEFEEEPTEEGGEEEQANDEGGEEGEKTSEENNDEEAVEEEPVEDEGTEEETTEEPEETGDEDEAKKKSEENKVMKDSLDFSETLKLINESYDELPKAIQDRYDELFKKLVPVRGDCETYGGEALRAVSRLGYRWYNDGDKVFYWDEGDPSTVNPSWRWLKENLNWHQGIIDILDDLEDNSYNDTKYSQFLDQLTMAIVAAIDDPGNKEFMEKPLNGDSIFNKKYENKEEDNPPENENEDEDEEQFEESVEDCPKCHHHTLMVDKHNAQVKCSYCSYFDRGNQYLDKDLQRLAEDDNTLKIYTIDYNLLDTVVEKVVAEGCETVEASSLDSAIDFLRIKIVEKYPNLHLKATDTWRDPHKRYWLNVLNIKLNNKTFDSITEADDEEAEDNEDKEEKKKEDKEKDNKKEKKDDKKDPPAKEEPEQKEDPKPEVEPEEPKDDKKDLTKQEKIELFGKYLNLWKSVLRTMGKESYSSLNIEEVAQFWDGIAKEWNPSDPDPKEFIGKDNFEKLQNLKVKK